jgi:putative addiction module component (TIGR02574 family)
MAGITPEASQILERALDLSTQDRGALIARLIDSLDDAPIEAGVEEAWAAEIKRRAQWQDVSRIESTIRRGLRLRPPMSGIANAATTRGRHLF